MQTKHGAVQFGIPPETIKDPMRLGLEVPSYYVVPKERFNLKFGTNTCEGEFPAYWNFFIKGKSTTLVCNSEAASVITNVMDEVLEGPKEEFLYTEDEYSAFVDEAIFEARPDHLKEINYFKEPRNGRVIATSTLVKFAMCASRALGAWTGLWCGRARGGRGGRGSTRTPTRLWQIRDERLRAAGGNAARGGRGRLARRHRRWCAVPGERRAPREAASPARV